MPLPATIKIGTAGWSYADWVGPVYPRLRHPGFHQAAYLAQYFDTLEINTSFYRPVRPEHARLWALRVAYNQRFPVHCQTAPLLHPRRQRRPGGGARLSGHG